jgi:hypothetical protein
MGVMIGISADDPYSVPTIFAALTACYGKR